MQSNEITEPLTPLIQVASLLQARKETAQDVQVILEICSTLSTAQVIKVKNVEKIQIFRGKKIQKVKKASCRVTKRVNLTNIVFISRF